MSFLAIGCKFNVAGAVVSSVPLTLLKARDTDPGSDVLVDDELVAEEVPGRLKLTLLLISAAPFLSLSLSFEEVSFAKNEVDLDKGDLPWSNVVPLAALSVLEVASFALSALDLSPKEGVEAGDPNEKVGFLESVAAAGLAFAPSLLDVSVDGGAPKLKFFLSEAVVVAGESNEKDLGVSFFSIFSVDLVAGAPNVKIELPASFFSVVGADLPNVKVGTTVSSLVFSAGLVTGVAA